MPRGADMRLRPVRRDAARASRRRDAMPPRRRSRPPRSPMRSTAQKDVAAGAIARGGVRVAERIERKHEGRARTASGSAGCFFEASARRCPKGSGTAASVATITAASAMERRVERVDRRFALETRAGRRASRRARSRTRRCRAMIDRARRGPAPATCSRRVPRTVPALRVTGGRDGWSAVAGSPRRCSAHRARQAEVENLHVPVGRARTRSRASDHDGRCRARGRRRAPRAICVA